MIDIHSHILPDVDDGPATMQEALQLARAAWKSGTRTIVATPHVLYRLNSTQNSGIQSVYRDFRAILQAELPELSLLLGSELYFQPGLSELAQYPVATINASGRYLLVEFPLLDIPRGFERELMALQAADLIPIIAHPERNGLVARKPATVGKMVESGALIQLNAGSLTGAFGPTAEKLAHYLLTMGWVHFLASDAHGRQHRGPELSGALGVAAEVIGVAAARRLVQDHPQRVILGQPWPSSEVAETLEAERL